VPTNLVATAVFAVIFVGVIVRQLLGRGPGIWVLFLAGGLLTILSGVLSVGGAELVLADDAPILLFLLALFVFAQALEASGALDHLARWVIGRAETPAQLPFVLFVGIGLVSSLFINDALVLIGVPILVGVATRLRADPKPLLLVLAFSVTVGSTLTPFGNPQNLLVAVAGGFSSPVTTFFRYLALPTVLNLLLGGWYLNWAFRRSMPAHDTHFEQAHAGAPPLLPTGGWGRRLARYPVLWIFPGTMIVLITLDIASALTHGPAVPVWEIAIGGAVLLLVASPRRVRILHQVNWPILMMFAGLFVVVQGAVIGGVVTGLESILPIPGPGHTTAAMLTVVATSLGGSQLVSNVPWVGLQIPLLTGLGYSASTPVVWMALAAGSTLAGNVTLLGAASNLIVTETAEQLQIRIRLWDFVREGLPLTAITVTVLVACLLVGL
jgi:Na+/H+ antiporter NhaD/arsenite permease-like protein